MAQLLNEVEANGAAGSAERLDDILAFHPATLQWWPQPVLGLPAQPVTRINSAPFLLPSQLFRLEEGLLLLPGFSTSVGNVVADNSVVRGISGVCAPL